MIDRDKVINGLEKCAAIHQGFICESCVYPGCNCAIDDAISLLKAQEPRVMTLEEIPERQETTGWLEWRDGDFYAAILYANDLKIDYMKFCTSCAFMKNEYGVNVRCWTSCPTDEQREATPWTQTNGLL